MKVVIDTNILVSIIGKKSSSRWIFDSIANGKLKICVSTEIVLEYREILQRKTNLDVAENIIEFMKVSPNVIKTDTYFRFNLIQKDSTDNKFVDCAITGDVDHILSNDKHFQILKSIDFPKVSII